MNKTMTAALCGIVCATAAFAQDGATEAQAPNAGNGTALSAESFAGPDRLENAKKAFAERLAGFPQNVVEAALAKKEDGTPDIQTDQYKGTRVAPVEIRVNAEKFSEWAKSFAEVLDAVSAEKEAVSLGFADGIDKMTAPVPFRPGDAVPVVVATPKPAKVERTSWPATVYYLDKQMYATLVAVLKESTLGKGVLEIVLKDEDGDSVASTRGVFFNNPSLRNGVASGMAPVYMREGYPLFFAPAFKLDLTRGASRAKDLSQRVGFDLGKVSDDMLADVVSETLTVEYTK